MKGEIDKDFYCSGSFFDKGRCDRFSDHVPACFKSANLCNCYHRKYPTPEQFKEEYGEDVPDDMPVWVLVRTVSKIMVDGKSLPDAYTWSLEQYGGFEKHNSYWNLSFYNMNANLFYREIVKVCVACTPGGKPPDTWRPE